MVGMFDFIPKQASGVGGAILFSRDVPEEWEFWYICVKPYEELAIDTRNSRRASNACADRRNDGEIFNSKSRFCSALADEKERAYQEGLATGKRKRKPGRGQKGKLPTIYDNLTLFGYNPNKNILSP